MNLIIQLWVDCRTVDEDVKISSDPHLWKRVWVQLGARTLHRKGQNELVIEPNWCISYVSNCNLPPWQRSGFHKDEMSPYQHCSLHKLKVYYDRKLAWMVNRGQFEHQKHQRKEWESFFIMDPHGIMLSINDMAEKSNGIHVIYDLIWHMKIINLWGTNFIWPTLLSIRCCIRFFWHGNSEKR